MTRESREQQRQHEARMLPRAITPGGIARYQAERKAIRQKRRKAQEQAS